MKFDKNLLKYNPNLLNGIIIAALVILFIYLPVAMVLYFTRLLEFNKKSFIPIMVFFVLLIIITYLLFFWEDCNKSLEKEDGKKEQDSVKDIVEESEVHMQPNSLIQGQDGTQSDSQDSSHTQDKEEVAVLPVHNMKEGTDSKVHAKQQSKHSTQYTSVSKLQEFKSKSDRLKSELGICVGGLEELKENIIEVLIKQRTSVNDITRKIKECDNEKEDGNLSKQIVELEKLVIEHNACLVEFIELVQSNIESEVKFLENSRSIGSLELFNNSVPECTGKYIAKEEEIFAKLEQKEHQKEVVEKQIKDFLISENPDISCKFEIYMSDNDRIKKYLKAWVDKGIKCDLKMDVLMQNIYNEIGAILAINNQLPINVPCVCYRGYRKILIKLIEKVNSQQQESCPTFDQDCQEDSVQSSCDEELTSERSYVPQEKKIVFDPYQFVSDVERLDDCKKEILIKIEVCENDIERYKQCLYKELDEKEEIIDYLLKECNNFPNLKRLMKKCQGLYKDYYKSRKEYYECCIKYMEETKNHYLKGSESSNDNFSEESKNQSIIINMLYDMGNKHYRKLSCAIRQLSSALETKGVTQPVIDQLEKYKNYVDVILYSNNLSNQLLLQSNYIQELKDCVLERRSILDEQRRLRNANAAPTPTLININPIPVTAVQDISRIKSKKMFFR
ncbi:hypothetical protein K6025_02710 [Ehrlichia sp. JZT12]